MIVVIAEDSRRPQSEPKSETAQRFPPGFEFCLLSTKRLVGNEPPRFWLAQSCQTSYFCCPERFAAAQNPGFAPHRELLWPFENEGPQVYSLFSVQCLFGFESYAWG